MYIIRILDEINKDKCWVGHSNSRDSYGFYLTRENTAGIFTKDISKIPKLKEWLNVNNYTYDIIEVTESKYRRVY